MHSCATFGKQITQVSDVAQALITMILVIYVNMKQDWAMKTLDLYCLKENVILL